MSCSIVAPILLVFSQDPDEGAIVALVVHLLDKLIAPLTPSRPSASPLIRSSFQAKGLRISGIGMFKCELEGPCMEAFGQPLRVRGYSVVDLVVIISILGIFVATAVPSYQLLKDRSDSIKTAFVE